MGQLRWAHATHITNTHYSRNSAPPSTRSDGFLWITISSCCCITRYYNTLDRAKMALVQAVILTLVEEVAAGSHATAAAVLIPGPTPAHLKHCCNFRSQDAPWLDHLRGVAPAVPSAERTRARTSCCLRRRDGKECVVCTPTTVPRLFSDVCPRHHILFYTRGDFPEFIGRT